MGTAFRPGWFMNCGSTGVTPHKASPRPAACRSSATLQPSGKPLTCPPMFQLNVCTPLGLPPALAPAVAWWQGSFGSSATRWDLAAVFSTSVTRAPVHLDSWLGVASAPGGLPFVIPGPSACTVPLPDTDRLPSGLGLGGNEPAGVLGADIYCVGFSSGTALTQPAHWSFVSTAPQ